MANNRNRQDIVPSSSTSYSPDRGPLTDPNPGERSALADTSGAPLNSLGLIPARGNRAGGGQQIDTGAQVGVMLNMEFAAGGRAHRLITGTYGPARPTLDPRSGGLHTSAAVDTNISSLGPASNDSPSNATEPVQSTPTDDSATGSRNADRRRDTRGT